MQLFPLASLFTRFISNCLYWKSDGVTHFLGNIPLGALSALVVATLPGEESSAFGRVIRRGGGHLRGKVRGGERFFCHKFWQFGIYAYLCGVAQLAREGMVGDRKYDKRRFRTFVFVEHESRKFQTRNRQMTAKRLRGTFIYIIYNVLAWANCVVCPVWVKAMREPVFPGRAREQTPAPFYCFPATKNYLLNNSLFTAESGVSASQKLFTTMKKMIFSLVAALCCSASLFAEELQEELVATLNHKGTLTAYYGETAFAEAMENADHGDEITLSGGTFSFSKDETASSVMYDKAVTIRGTGIRDNAEKKTKATCITKKNTSGRRIIFNLSSDIEAKLKVEGVFFTDCEIVLSSSDMAETSFSKCDARLYTCDGSLLRLTNCIGSISATGNGTGYGIFKNCYVARNANLSSLKCEYNHCTIAEWCPDATAPYSTYTDCIGYNYSLGVFPLHTKLINCVIRGGRDDVFANAETISCTDLNYSDYESLFVTGTTPNGPMRSPLTDEAKSLYPASDGTEIGIYGGEYPWTYEVGLPLVTKLILGNRTSAGKLPVTIEVK